MSRCRTRITSPETRLRPEGSRSAGALASTIPTPADAKEPWIVPSRACSMGASQQGAEADQGCLPPRRSPILPICNNTADAAGARQQRKRSTSALRIQAHGVEMNQRYELGGRRKGWYNRSTVCRDPTCIISRLRGRGAPSSRAFFARKVSTPTSAQ
jgi:hypothetical protein